MKPTPELPLLTRHQYRTHKSQASDNIRLLINLVLQSNHNDDQKFDLIDTLSHLAVTNCPENEIEVWSQYRAELLKGVYMTSEGETHLGKGYVGRFKDSRFFINRKSPEPSVQMIALLKNLKFNWNRYEKRTDKEWGVKLNQTTATHKVIYDQIMNTIKQEIL
jgi:hypothetical protein